MSNKLISVEELSSGTRKEIVSTAVTAFETGRKAYVVAGKACVALASVLRGKETVYGLLEKAGLSKSQIANGRQIAMVYETYVATGKMTEVEFDNSINYGLAVSLNKLTAKNATMAEAYLGEPEEWKSLADTGMTTQAHSDFLVSEAKAKAETDAKIHAAKVKAEAEKLNAEAEPEAEAEVEVAVEAEAEAEAEAEPEVAVEAEAETEVEPETKAKATKPATAPVPMSKLPMLRNSLDKLEALATEIAMEQPGHANEALALVDQYLTAIKSTLEVVATSEAQLESVNF
jgi:hypothetical protein